MISNIEINIVAGVAENQVIGAKNKLLWHLPADMKYFRLLTTGHIVIMGRKTFDSIGRPLPNRENIIITRNKNCILEGGIVVNSLDEAIEKAKEINEKLDINSKKIVFIIGGEQIYKLSMNLAQKLYITNISTIENGDAFFPKIDNNIWEQISCEPFKRDEKNKFDLEFVVYDRIKT